MVDQGPIFCDGRVDYDKTSECQVNVRPYEHPALSAAGREAGQDGGRVSADAEGASFNLDAVKAKIEAARAAVAR